MISEKPDLVKEIENNNNIAEPHSDDQTRTGHDLPFLLMRDRHIPEDVKDTVQIEAADIVSEMAVLCLDTTKSASHNVKADPINNIKKEIQNLNSDSTVIPSVKAVLDRGFGKAAMVEPLASREKCCDDSQSDPLQKSLFEENVAVGTDIKDPNLLSNKMDPNMAKLANIFDSHCHIDRIYNYWKHSKVENPVGNLSRKFPEVFGRKFEGCIAVNCDPRLWRVRA